MINRVKVTNTQYIPPEKFEADFIQFIAVNGIENITAHAIVARDNGTIECHPVHRLQIIKEVPVLRSPEEPLQ